MSAFNPYEPPTANPFQTQEPSGANAGISPMMVETLRSTKPWVMFLAILGFVACGLMVIGSLAIMVAGSQIPNMPPWIGAVYLVMAAILAIPAVQMLRFSTAIDRFILRPESTTLEQVLDSQRSYWRTVGIMALCYIGLIGLACVGGVMAGIAGMHH